MILWRHCIENFHNVLLDHWLLVSLVLTIVLLYCYYTRTFTFFKDLGVEYIEPSILVGNFWDKLLHRKGAHDLYVDIYKHFNNLPYGGYFEGSLPRLLIRDPELIKTIFIRDFNAFPNKNRDLRPAQPCVRRTLLSLKSGGWRQARSLLTPSFTTGKLKAMEGLIQQCGEQLIEFLMSRSDDEKIFEMRNFSGRYAVQAIAACAFNLECNSLKDPDSAFFTNALGLFKDSKFSKTVFHLLFLFYPKFAKHTPFSAANTMATKYFSDLVDRVRAVREQQKEAIRADFLQNLMNCAEKERLENPQNKLVDDLFIHGQSVFFFSAGFLTTSTLLGFACHVLAVHPEIQNRLRNDILEAYEEYGNVFTYDSVNSITYLEYVLNETLRMYPPVPKIERECVEMYSIPGTKVTLNPGDVVAISLSGIMSDPNYFPEPWKFNPDRFSPHDTSTVKEMFMPFGLGPRKCIGLRFALMSAKFYLCFLLKNFKLNPFSKTQYPILFDKTAALFLKAEKGNWIKIEPLSSSVQ